MLYQSILGLLDVIRSRRGVTYDCCWRRNTQSWRKSFPWNTETHHGKLSTNEKGSAAQTQQSDIDNSTLLPWWPMTSIYELPGWNNPYGKGWNEIWMKEARSSDTAQFALDTSGMPRMNTLCSNLLQSWVLPLSSFSATHISSLLRGEVYFSASVKRG